MKIIKIISENKKTKKNAIGGYKAKIGYAEAIVEENEKLVTRHGVRV